jgi:hypothetical protein
MILRKSLSKLKLIVSGLMHRIKGTLMNDLIEKQLYLGIVAVLKDQKLYYESSIGGKGAYNHFQDGGKEALLLYIETMAPLILKNEREKLDNRAKELMWEELKK